MEVSNSPSETVTKIIDSPNQFSSRVIFRVSSIIVTNTEPLSLMAE